MNCTTDKHIDLVFPCTRFGTCNNKICVNCSYIIDDLHYCEDCQNDIHQEAYEQFGICPNCGEECAPIYEDMHPDGLGYNEIVGWKPCVNCSQSEE